MLFIFKQKPIYVDCFTSRSDVYKVSNIDYSYKFYPEWWKKLDKTFEVTDNNIKLSYPSMKSCYGFVEQYKRGIIMPLWTDFAIRVGNLNDTGTNWKFSDCITSIELHTPKQRGDYLPTNKYTHLKIVSPWHFKCKEDIKFSFQSCFWNFETPESILIPPGILEFKYQSATNVNVFFDHREKERTIIFKFGQPLVQFMPLSDRKLKINTHLVSENEYRNLSLPRVTFTSTIKANRQTMLKKEKSCPFKF